MIGKAGPDMNGAGTFSPRILGAKHTSGLKVDIGDIDVSGRVDLALGRDSGDGRDGENGEGSTHVDGGDCCCCCWVCGDVVRRKFVGLISVAEEDWSVV